MTGSVVFCNTNVEPIAGRMAGAGENSGVNDSLYVSNSEYESNNFKEDKEINLNFSSFNYPNPFNDYTHIFYYVKETMPVTITVYNMYYQKVITLVNNFHHPAGKFILTLEAGKLSPGLYFYTIQSEDGLVERYKMILTR